MKYRIPISYVVTGTIEVEADSVADALMLENFTLDQVQNPAMLPNSVDVEANDVACLDPDSVTVYTYEQLKEVFRQHERVYPSKPLTAVIVFKPESWPDHLYPLASRSYRVSSDNKAFQPHMGGYSIYADSLDGSDLGVRLERYMKEEQGGSAGWIVDFCYMERT
jgi:hypothetical protein